MKSILLGLGFLLLYYLESVPCLKLHIMLFLLIESVCPDSQLSLSVTKEQWNKM
jgi:hypothetical protein